MAVKIIELRLRKTWLEQEGRSEGSEGGGQRWVEGSKCGK